MSLLELPPLEELYPSREAREADLFLESFRRLSLAEQIRTRRVLQVVLQSLRPQVHGVLSTRTGPPGLWREYGFIIGVRRQDSTEQRILSVGHELAHTFGFDITRSTGPWEHVCVLSSSQTEYLCQAFAVRWIALHSRTELEALVINGWHETRQPPPRPF